MAEKIIFRFAGGTLEEDLRALILHGVQIKASDIHFNPRQTGCELAFRINGDLVSHQELDYETEYALVEYALKKMAGANPVSHTPQDGRIEFTYGKKSTSLRFASIQSKVHKCSKITMRITDKDPTLLQLEALGLDPAILESMYSSLSRNFGLFLTTGPTGSGKTTTLYGALNFIKTVAPYNIMTIEDPVEYPIDGVVQIETDPVTTYDEVIKNFMRQDPDVIMVGEIRDAESAQTAIRASLTGHLVISTKKLCQCRIKYPIEEHEKIYFTRQKKRPPEFLYKENPAGCELCKAKSPGIASRMGVYEMIEFNSSRQNKLFALIQAGHEIEGTFQEYYRLQNSQYMPLHERLLVHLFRGDISVSEYVRLQ